MKPITYMSDQPGDYVKALSRARSVDALRAVTAAYAEIAPDADEIAKRMTAKDFKRFRAGMKLEREGAFAGEEFAVEFGAVLMPEIMFKVGMVASQFGAPWGCAYIRMKESGQLSALTQPGGC